MQDQGTLEFDGVRYLDGRASDPRLLGWMQGTPPPAERRVRFADDQFLEFPQIRWTLSHMRELVPTVNVWRGPSPASALGDPPAADKTSAIDELAFTDMNGRARRWDESLYDTYTDGILVLHRGRCIYERYFGALQPQLPHSCFSITKSYAATLAATLVHEGVLDDTQRVPHYLPEMRGTAYEDATLREVMDMQIGVAYSELYADPQAQIWAYARAGGLRPRPAGYNGPADFYEYLATLHKEGEHGQAFAYKTVNTELLCWVMKRATGQPLAEMLSERLWSRLGCEQDGHLTVDSIGVAMAAAD
jgi:CubicO group peptidase (beta-lactamase class C family)